MNQLCGQTHDDGMACCDRPEGHDGFHTWEAVRLISELRMQLAIEREFNDRLAKPHRLQETQ